MILRNKKTGELWELIYRYPNELNEDWEYYKPAEPLIKDEKIRKAVRAWANVNCIMQVIYAKRKDNSLSIFTDYDGDDDFSIEFVGWIPTLIDAEVYTIDELCGGIND